MSNRLSKQQASSCLLRQKSLFAESGNSTLSRSKDQFDLASTASSVFGWVLVCRCTIDNPIQHAMMMYIYIYQTVCNVFMMTMSPLFKIILNNFAHQCGEILDMMWLWYQGLEVFQRRTQVVGSQIPRVSFKLFGTTGYRYIMTFYDVLGCFIMFYDVFVYKSDMSSKTFDVRTFK